jgi:asparagine synthase (glutamine-hydrolysing)
MCGIFFHLSNKEIDYNFYKKKSLLQTHRGPDKTNFVIDKFQNFSLFFASNLLNTIGKFNQSLQPVNKENYILILNGSIYNYVDLAKKYGLNDLDSDTLVLGEGLFKTGINFLNDCNGTFSFVFFNKISKEIIFSRDFYGVRPMYIRQDIHSISIASEYKAIANYSDDLDIQSVSNFLKYRYTNKNNTLLKKIKKAKPGSAYSMQLVNQKIKIDETILEKFKKNEKSLIQNIDSSISSRLISNQKSSLILSGGIDSCYLAYVMNQNHIDFEAYTYVTDDNFEDLKKVKSFCKFLSIKLNEVKEEEYTFDKLKQITYHLDDPYGDPIIFSLNDLAKSISNDKIRICYNGEGVDEIFGGYTHHKIFMIISFIKKYYLNGFVSSTLKYLPDKILNSFFEYSLKLSKNDMKIMKKKIHNILNNSSILELYSIISDEDLIYKDPEIIEKINDIRIKDLTDWLPNSQLFKMDKIFMRYSIENRDPYLSRELVSHATSIPIQKNFSIFSDKLSFRKSISNTKFPMQFFQKKKHAFTRKLIDNNFYDELYERIIDRLEFLQQFLEKDFLEKLLNTNNTKSVIMQKQLFTIGSLLAWQENHENR